MYEHNFTTAAVIGTGMMGPGIGLTLALGGVQTTILSRTPEGAAEGLASAHRGLDLLLRNELVDPEAAKNAAQLLISSTNLEAAVGAVDLIIESGPENMSWKQELFGRLDTLTRPETVLASNTSGLSITAIALNCAHPERVVTTHFWNPPHLIPAVEIVKGEHTSAEVVHAVRDLLIQCGKTPVLVQKDRPGQLGNRLQMALLREAAYIISEGIATAEDVDRVLMTGLGLRYPAYGLLEHADIVGLDMGLSISEYVTPDLCSEAAAPPYLRNLVTENKLGAKTGQGFRHWKEGDAVLAKARRDQFLIDFLRSKRLTEKNS